MGGSYLKILLLFWLDYIRKDERKAGILTKSRTHLRYFVNTIRNKQARISLVIMKIGSDINRGDECQVFPSLIARLSALTPKFERLLFGR